MLKYVGGLLVLAYGALHLAGLDRWSDDERGELPADVQKDRSAILLWHTGFMGGK
jgi:hypothetical protein